MRRLLAFSLALFATHCGGPVTSRSDVATGNDASVTPPVDSAPPPPDDPRPIEERACPAGAVLQTQLWNVYAMPRDGNGEVWDGLSGDNIALLCTGSAALVRIGVRQAINMAIAGGGTAADQLFGSAFEQGVRERCGLAANWLQERYEGPDLFALGRYATDSTHRWQTPAVQDRFIAALRTTTTGDPAGWQTGCGASSTTAVLELHDEDIAFDDLAAALSIEIGTLPPAVICGGWGFIEFPENTGIFGALFRVSAVGGNQNCAGIAGERFEDFIIPAQFSVRIPTTSQPASSTTSASPTAVHIPRN